MDGNVYREMDEQTFLEYLELYDNRAKNRDVKKTLINIWRNTSKEVFTKFIKSNNVTKEINIENEARLRAIIALNEYYPQTNYIYNRSDKSKKKLINDELEKKILNCDLFQKKL